MLEVAEALGGEDLGQGGVAQLPDVPGQVEQVELGRGRQDRAGGVDDLVRQLPGLARPRRGDPQRDVLVEERRSAAERRQQLDTHPNNRPTQPFTRRPLGRRRLWVLRVRQSW